ncbi:class F sortase [Modestobacter sp. VKM Ac-2986]|uniref:class F sortase n=1 Tax=Modestobacter sp. VKM Ac-2986 TaxID=3004140 RepID=UPI0022ABA7DF|nr:class F sortase [Modestobacter sp. VKM Ac-2986]MCZ2830805.1 class F sortase [Modestobacter sp. VKM Ac-2986]
MRIAGVYPPPLPGAARPASPQPAPPQPVPPGLQLADDVLAELRRPRVTRYDRSRPAAPSRPSTTRVWTGTSVVLAAAGVAAVVLVPHGGPQPVRLDVPVAASVPAPVAGQPADAAALQLPASAPVRVRIPALGVTSAVIELGLQDDGSMEVPRGAYPVGWYDRSPTPGELGPAVLAGHVDWAGEPGALYGLRELLPGDEVVVERADGTVATFRVDRVEEHDKDAFPSDEVYGDLPTAGLRLITCGGSFDSETGDYDDNVIVFATLVSGG